MRDSKLSAALSIACILLSWCVRICAWALCGLTIVLCFAGFAHSLGIVGLVVDISRALPSVISGYGLVATPFGGVFRFDFALSAVILFALDRILLAVAARIRPRNV